MKNTIHPVILAGGGGTRLWPLSRRYYPKQFLSLDEKDSMLQKTVLRMEGLSTDSAISDPIIICNEEHRFLVAENIEDINKSCQEIILEPVGRNTAPALTVAALRIDDPDAIMLMMPADHIIPDISILHEAINKAVEIANDDYFLTFGIQPDKPETGYGYIKTADEISKGEHCNAYAIEEFVEKPDRVRAQEYLESGKYYWNSGIFLMKTSLWLDAIMEFAPDIYKQSKKSVENGQSDGQFFRLNENDFSNCPDDSIDYAVMERVTVSDKFRSALVSLDAGWSDIGSWAAVWEVGEKDSDQNVIKGDVITEGTRNSIVYSEHRLVTTVGCEDILVIETADAVLVGNREQAQDVKKLVDSLQGQEREERLTHREVFRPWGSYESLDEGINFQVKRLKVKPGKKLSLQLHHKRAEHWVVVRGIATVTRGTEVFKLKENESTYIPLGEKHRLENTEDGLLEVIEVQSGSYLGEDDIVRFDDDFGRVD